MIEHFDHHLDNPSVQVLNLIEASGSKFSIHQSAFFLKGRVQR